MRDELAQVIDRATGFYIDGSQLEAAADAVLGFLGTRTGVDNHAINLAAEVDDFDTCANMIHALLVDATAPLHARIAELERREAGWNTVLEMERAAHDAQVSVLEAQNDNLGVGANALEAERDAALATIEKVRLVRTWENEDGKRFVFADDLRDALAPEVPK